MSACMGLNEEKFYIAGQVEQLFVYLSVSGFMGCLSVGRCLAHFTINTTVHAYT